MWTILKFTIKGGVKLEKKYITNLIYNLLEKGYSKEVILFYITSTVDTN